MTWNIVTDSSCDLFPSQSEDGQVRLSSVSFVISVGKTDFVDDETLDVPAMLEAMEKEPAASHTSCPSPQAWLTEFERADNVIALTISSQLSGTYHAACIARDMVLEEHPDRQICVIDSRAASGTMALLVRRARQLMEDPALSWRAGVETFLKNCCYGAESGVAVLSIEEEQQARRCLSEENFQAFRQDQVSFYGKLLSIFGLPTDGIDPRLFGNLALAMMMVHKAIPDTMPFLFPEVAEDMVDFQVRALVDEMERVKEHVR